MATQWQVESAARRVGGTALSPDRGGYTLTMRECAGADECIAALRDAAPMAPARALHVGWGSFRNLDLAAAARVAAMLLLDVNEHQFRVWRAVAQVLPDSRSAADFIDRAAVALPNEPRLRQFGTDTRRWLRGDLERPGSWLFEGDPDGFQRVRELFTSGQVATAALDLRDGAGMARLEAELGLAAQDGWQLQTTYVSNIPWMLAQPVGFFGEHHGTLVGERSVLEAAREHLAPVVMRSRRVVSAMHLRADATADNLQWQTELLSPADFLEPARWRVPAVP